MGLYIDILLATFNGERYLKQQLDSILEQTFQDFKIIIRDDGSTDRTLEIIRHYSQNFPDKIILLPISKNLGIRGNFSELMQASTASYIMFCDQDDFWEKNKISVTLSRMLELENLQGKDIPILVHTDLKVVDKTQKLIHSSFWKYAKLYPEKARTLNRLLVQNAITGCTIMINRALLAKSFPIPNECLMHDWWLGLVASAFGIVSPLPISTMHYRQHGSNSLGAQKYTFKSTFSKWIKMLRNTPEGLAYRKKNIEQAEIFKKRFEQDLTKSQNLMLNVYLNLDQQSLLKEIYLCYTHAFLKQGLARNVGSFLGKIIKRTRLSS